MPPLRRPRRARPARCPAGMSPGGSERFGAGRAFGIITAPHCLPSCSGGIDLTRRRWCAGCAAGTWRRLTRPTRGTRSRSRPAALWWSPAAYRRGHARSWRSRGSREAQAFKRNGRVPVLLRALQNKRDCSARLVLSRQTAASRPPSKRDMEGWAGRTVLAYPSAVTPTPFPPTLLPFVSRWQRGESPGVLSGTSLIASLAPDFPQSLQTDQSTNASAQNQRQCKTGSSG